jgi:hypothetical protein
MLMLLAALSVLTQPASFGKIRFYDRHCTRTWFASMVGVGGLTH